MRKMTRAQLLDENTRLKDRIDELEDPGASDFRGRYQTIFDRALDGIFICRLDGTILDVNPAGCRMHGYTRDELIGASAAILVHPDSLPDFQRFVEAIAAGEEFTAEAVDVRKDGSLLNIEIRGAPMLLDNQPHLIGILQDTTQRMKAEEELRVSEEKLRTLFEESSEIITFTDENANPLMVNPAWHEIFGPTLEVEENPFERIHPDDVEAVANAWEALLTEGIRIQNLEYRYRVGADYLHFESNAFPIPVGGSVNHCVIARNVTDRKRSEQMLRESKERLAAAEAVAHSGTLDWNPETDEMIWSDEAFRLHGYQPGEIQPTIELAMNAVHPDDLPRIEQSMTAALQGEEMHDIDHRLVQRDGEVIWVHARMDITRGEDGTPIRVLGTHVDITDRKLIEDELKAYRVKLEELVEQRTAELSASEQRLAEETAATAAIVNELLAGMADDAETEMQVLNACLAATGSKHGMIGVINEHGKYDTTTYNGESLSGCAFPEAMAWELSTGLTIRGVWGAPMLRGEPVICNDLQSHPDRVGQPEGHVPIESFLGVPVKEGEIVTGMVAVANREGGFTDADRDTLARLVAIMNVGRKYREALDLARMTSRDLQEMVTERTGELETLNAELESFAYSVSHDLRAPLRAIEGFSQILLEDQQEQLDEEGKRYLNLVSSETQNMAGLIDDLLKLSRVTRADMTVTSCDLSGMAEEVMKRLRQADPERRAEVMIADGLETEGDPQLLKMVIENILDNAWKFTSRTQSALIEFGLLEDEDNRVFYIRDNGVGFDMKHEDRLFEPFQRLHGKTEFPGTGIGLSTVKRIIQRHGGRVWLESEKGAGTTCYFTLPE